MIIGTSNRKERLMKSAQDVAESLTCQLGNLQGALALLRYDINDSLDKGECVQRSWVDSLSVISFVLEKLEKDSDELAERLIELQKLEKAGKEN